MPTPTPRSYAAKLAAPRRRERYAQAAAPATSAAQDRPIERRDRPRDLIPHERTFAAVWGQGLNLYRSYADEALRANYRDAMAMRRDHLIDELIRQRKFAVTTLPWEIVPDDPKSKEQRKVADRMAQIIKATPRFQNLRNYLGEGIFFGKYGSQGQWLRKRVSGKAAIVYANHKPINGDKILFGFDDVPGILVNSGFTAPGVEFRQGDRGRVMMLADPAWRERVIVHEFEPVDADFLTEGDMAGAVHGLGLRSRLWFAWRMRMEIASWGLDGLQRLGTAGQLYGFYPAGNADARDNLIDSLRMLARDNVAVFERNPGGNPDSEIRSIPASGVAYEVIQSWVAWCEDAMRRNVLGQNLTSEAAPTGMGSKVAEAHESTFERYIRFDAGNLDETLTNDLVAVSARHNFGDLGFGLEFRSLIDKEDGLDMLDKAGKLHAMGIAFDTADLVEQAGFKAAKADEPPIPAPPPGPDADGEPEPGPPAPPEPSDRVQYRTSRAPAADAAPTTATVPAKTPAAAKAPGKPNCGTGHGGFRPGNVCGKGKRAKMAAHIAAARANAHAHGSPEAHRAVRDLVRALKAHRRNRPGAIDNARAKSLRGLLADAPAAQRWAQALPVTVGKPPGSAPVDPATHGDHAPGHVGDLDVALIHADPQRFQFKSGYGAGGSVGSLAGVQRFDPDLAGIVQVWKDPADGKTYVVNGHNRIELAKRLGASRATVRYIHAKDAEEARAKGALTNIAEGRGTALDAAKFFRDTGLTRDQIRERGIPLREKVATDGLALAKLEPKLFDRVVSGEIAPERGAIIGGSGLAPHEQSALAALVDRQRGEVTNAHLRELADEVRSARSVRDEGSDLFGSFADDHSLALHKTKLQAQIKDRLGKEKRLFGVVAKSKHATELARAGNSINTGESARISDAAATTLGVFDRLKNLSGPVSRALNDAAERINRGENSRSVTDETYRRILADLPALLDGGGVFAA